MQVRLSAEIADQVRARQDATGASAASVVNEALWLVWLGEPERVQPITPPPLPDVHPAAPPVTAPRAKVLTWR